MKHLISLTLCVLLLGCSFTGPKGAYSFALNGEQIGVALSNTAVLANILMELRAKEAELQLAQEQGKPDKVQRLLEVIQALQERKVKVATKVEEEKEQAAEVLEASVEQ